MPSSQPMSELVHSEATNTMPDNEYPMFMSYPMLLQTLKFQLLPSYSIQMLTLVKFPPLLLSFCECDTVNGLVVLMMQLESGHMPFGFALYALVEQPFRSH